MELLNVSATAIKTQKARPMLIKGMTTKRNKWLKITPNMEARAYSTLTFLISVSPSTLSDQKIYRTFYFPSVPFWGEKTGGLERALRSLVTEDKG